MTSRRFPSPWRAETATSDANGQALAYLYSRDNDDEARQAKVLTKDEARRIAVNFARLPELLGSGRTDDGAASGRGIARVDGNSELEFLTVRAIEH
jgi:hypothetical protein